MRILTRYVLREFIVPLFYCMTGFVSIYVLFDLFGSLPGMLEHHLPFRVAVRYFCGYLSPYFHYLVPAALMLATLYTMWSFCRHSEITAMRASGVSFVTIVKPLLAVAAVMAAAVAYVNECYVPRNAHWAQRLKTNSGFDLVRMEKSDEVLFRNSSELRTWDVDATVGEDAAELSGVRVTVDRPGGTRLMTVSAERARYLDGEWWFDSPKVQHYDALGREIASPTPELDSMPSRCFPDFGEKPSDFAMQNRPWRYNSVRDRLRRIRNGTDLTDDARDECTYDAWAQIMSPFACIIITLFAIPAGISSGRQSVFRGIIGALGMYFSFYGVVIGAMVAAKAGVANPVFAAVFPAALFLVLGLRSFLKQR